MEDKHARVGEEARRCATMLRELTDGFAYCRMVYDAAGRPIDWVHLEVNPAYGRLMEVADAAGRTATSLWPGLGESNPEVFEICGRVAAGGGPEVFETGFGAVDRCLRVSVSSPHLGYFAGMYADLADRECTRAATCLSQLSLDRSADMIHWLTSDGRIIYVSESTCVRLGYTREEIVGLTLFELDPMMTVTLWAEHWKDLREQGTLKFESVHKSKVGEVFPVEVVANFVRHDDKEYNFAFARDITLRKRAMQDLHRAKAELEARNRELEETSRRLRQANKELIEIRDALAFQARTDALTGSLNRGAVLSRLEDEIARAERARTTLAVGILDIDHFKHINDTHGHPAGDVVLCEVVMRLAGALRPYDVFGRFGGEEFLIIVPGVDGPQAKDVFERLRRSVSSSPVSVGTGSVSLTISVGGVVRSRESAETLVQLADKALYSAKTSGRDRVVMVTPMVPESVSPGREASV